MAEGSVESTKSNHGGVNAREDLDDEQQPKVIGMALVVEEVGKLSKLAFRYPPADPTETDRGNTTGDTNRNTIAGVNHSRYAQSAAANYPHGKVDGKKTSQTSQNQHTSQRSRHQDNIFFTLPPSAMAKLFRTKPALCGQPMTLLVGGTVFCCRSVLLNHGPSSSQSQSDDNDCDQSRQSASGTVATARSSAATVTSAGAGSASPSSPALDCLVMFSIIVAVLPAQNSNYRDKKGLSAHGSSTRPDSSPMSKPEQNMGAGSESKAKSEREYLSQNYPVVRRIHLSLSRLCAALEREERRCLYMSRQVSMLLSIAGGQMDYDSDSTKAGSSNKMNKLKDGAGGSTKREQKLNEADRMELMITANPPPPIPYDHYNANSTDGGSGGDPRSPNPPDIRRAVTLHGNLAAELRDTFHALERNDLAIQTSPASLLTGRDGIVYINLHIAVIIEAATKRIREKEVKGVELALRPYHTILFPNVSAPELLRNISSTSSSNSDGDLSQRRLEKLLLVWDSQKKLTEMAKDAALPFGALEESAMSLIEFGACIPAPVITDATRFACQRGAVKLMSSLRLKFAQQFSHMAPIFLVVAALTGTAPNPVSTSGGNISSASSSSFLTLGDVKRFCRRAFEEITTPIGKSEGAREESEQTIPSMYRMLTDRLVAILTVDEINTSSDVDNLIESLLMSMTTWLRSHCIIVELKDFFVAIESSHSEKSSSGEKSKEPHEDKKIDKSAFPYEYTDEDFEYIFKVCMMRDYLSGSISSTALSWRLKKDNLLAREDALFIREFRDWGVRESKLQVVTRIPCDADDWGAC